MVAFSPDGRGFVTDAADRTVRVVGMTRGNTAPVITAATVVAPNPVSGLVSGSVQCHRCRRRRADLQRHRATVSRWNRHPRQRRGDVQLRSLRCGQRPGRNDHQPRLHHLHRDCHRQTSRDGHPGNRRDRARAERAADSGDHDADHCGFPPDRCHGCGQSPVRHQHW